MGREMILWMVPRFTISRARCNHIHTHVCALEEKCIVGVAVALLLIISLSLCSILFLLPNPLAREAGGSIETLLLFFSFALAFCAIRTLVDEMEI